MIPLVIVEGERAVLHLIEPDLPVAELRVQLSVYLEPGRSRESRFIWMSPEGPRLLDPKRAVGEQVPAEAEIEIHPR